jgi:hypothetical protein
MLSIRTHKFLSTLADQLVEHLRQHERYQPRDRLVVLADELSLFTRIATTVSHDYISNLSEEEPGTVDELHHSIDRVGEALLKDLSSVAHDIFCDDSSHHRSDSWKGDEIPPAGKEAKLDAIPPWSVAVAEEVKAQEEPDVQEADKDAPSEKGDAAVEAVEKGEE